VQAVRWVVDGMNVIGSRPDRWWRDRPGAMRTLVERLAAFGEPVTVVFDGRPRDVGGAAGVEVRFAGVADDEIAALVAADADPEDLCVVTSDSELAARVRAHGARVEGAGRFRDVIESRSS
jgi:predicted RNA-binding protein with PIN domain